MLEVVVYYMQSAAESGRLLQIGLQRRRIMDAVWQVAHRWTKLWGGLHGFPLAL